MRDITYHAFGKTFWLRAWAGSPRSWLLSARWKLRSFWQGKRERDFGNLDNWTRTLTGTNSKCYCPVGSITEFHVELRGIFGVWLEVQRGGPTRPCHCDKIMWLLFPDGHEDDINDYGLANLQAEYPGVSP